VPPKGSLWWDANNPINNRYSSKDADEILVPGQYSGPFTNTPHPWGSLIVTVSDPGENGHLASDHYRQQMFLTESDNGIYYRTLNYDVSWKDWEKVPKFSEFELNRFTRVDGPIYGLNTNAETSEAYGSVGIPYMNMADQSKIAEYGGLTGYNTDESGFFRKAKLGDTLVYKSNINNWMLYRDINNNIVRYAMPTKSIHAFTCVGQLDYNHKRFSVQEIDPGDSLKMVSQTNYAGATLLYLRVIFLSPIVTTSSQDVVIDLDYYNAGDTIMIAVESSSGVRILRFKSATDANGDTYTIPANTTASFSFRVVLLGNSKILLPFYKL